MDYLATITALANTDPAGWRAIAKYLKVLGWQLDRTGRLPDVIAHKQFQPRPQVAAFVPPAIWIEMGCVIGFAAVPTSFAPGKAAPAL